MSKGKIEKITEKEILEEHKKLSDLSPEQKDTAMAFLFVAVNRLADIIRSIITDEKTGESKKLSDVKEVEDILSLGPKWLNYTRKVKKKK